MQYIRYEKNFSSHTANAYQHDLEVFAAYIEADFGLDDPAGADADMIRAWLMMLLENGLTARSAGRKLSVLKTYWRFLLREGLAEVNMPNRVAVPKIRRPLPVYLKGSELSAVKAADVLPAEAREEDFETFRDDLIMEMFLQTGMRRAELISLRLCDVDAGSALLKVTGKRNKQRLIPFGPSLGEMIARYLPLRSEVSGGADAPQDPFYIRRGGAPLYPMLVYRLVRHRLESAGQLSKNSPHVLRHTFATTLLNNGAELNAVRQLLGHASLSATEVYTHTSFEELKKTYRRAHPRAGE